MRPATAFINCVCTIKSTQYDRRLGIPLTATLGIPLTATLGIPLTATLGIPLTATLGIPLTATLGIPLTATFSFAARETAHNNGCGLSQ